MLGSGGKLHVPRIALWEQVSTDGCNYLEFIVHKKESTVLFIKTYSMLELYDTEYLNRRLGINLNFLNLFSF